MQRSVEQLIQGEAIPNIESDFVQGLSKEEQTLLFRYRKGESLTDEVIFTLGPKLEDYLIKLFGIEKAYQALRVQLGALDPIQDFYHKIALPSIRKLRVDQNPKCSDAVKSLANQYQDSESECIQALLEAYDETQLSLWCQWVYQEKIVPYIHWQVFFVPKKLSYQDKISVEEPKPRMDYDWIGPTLSQKEIQYHIRYCIDCHTKENDSCSKGFWSKRDQGYRVNPLGRTLLGCPLGQKISEMHGMRKQHRILAALAVIMIDNPLCLVTGDRICNDCMVSCIYQKVDPVDTPSVESDTLQHVLKLPYGAEIYLLLAKWNPLKAKDYQYNPNGSGSVAVVGMGPSGFAMSYYLLMSGAQVMGFDGLPIREALEEVNQPIEDFYTWADRVQPEVSGFGGVIDYGITVRWDKRLILLVWVLLRRFPKFELMGSTRMGGSIRIETLSELGFDQVVMATGAGLPKAHPIQTKQGIYFANEFLMRLHLSGVMHHEERSGFKLPIMVIGGGLTAIDAATEAQVHYVRWVMQVAFWVNSVGLDRLSQGLSDREMEVLSVWYRHGEFVRLHQKDPKVLNAYLQKEGGVHILYRRSMTESPAYKTNRLEIEKALEQGIQYHEHMNPISLIHEKGWVEGIVCESPKGTVKVKAKTVLIATGSQPNVAYYYENRDVFSLEDGYYKRDDDVFAASETYPGYVAMIGDLHPKYHGSVVGALASAKDHYDKIQKRLSLTSLCFDTIKQKLSIEISKIYTVSEGILGVKLNTQVDLPLGAYVKIAVMDHGVLMHLKGIVVQGDEAWVDQNQMGADLLKTEIPCGILGPSGTRILSQDVSDRVHIVTDQSGLIWAAAAVFSAYEQGKEPIVYGIGLGAVPKVLEGWKDVCDLVSSEEEDIVYCLMPEHLQKVQSQGCQFRRCYAICDGPMMCMLKGICGQCIQWQLDEEGKPLKAVFNCSWQVQPIELIDVEHYSLRKEVDTVENTLYKKWKGLIQEKQDVSQFDTVV